MKKLAGMRVTAGFTQEEVAQALGITQSSVSSWERHVGNPALDKVPRLADMYGVTSQDILDACACTSAANANIVNRKENLNNDQKLRHSI